MNVYDCCHISIIIMSSPVGLCTPPLCTYCICFRFYQKTYVVFVVLNEEKKEAEFVYGHLFTSVTLRFVFWFVFGFFCVVVAI